MDDCYFIDLRKYSLDKFKMSLQNRELIPSRVMLKEGIEDKFGLLKKQGIRSLYDLTDVLKTKPKLVQFSRSTGLSEQYLTLLKREAGSVHPAPVPLNKFPGISNETVNRLVAAGIRNSRQLFERVRTPKERKNLSELSQVPLEQIEALAGLCDLVRLYGVGPVFARMLYDIGIRSVAGFLSYEPEAIVRRYEEVTGKKADFSARDIAYSLELAKELKIVLQTG